MFKILSCKPAKPLFEGYQEIRIAGDMRGIFVNPKGVIYETTIAGCTCLGYRFNERCKHFTYLWERTPCSCSQFMQYVKAEDIYRCGLCGFTQSGEVVRERRVKTRRRMAS